MENESAKIENAPSQSEFQRGVSLPDDRLERLSDCVRRGEAIGMGEALEVIAYQELLKENRKDSLWQRLKLWLAN